VDPRTMEKVYIPVSPHEKAMQRALIQYRRPENYELVKEALIKAGRQELIGFDKACLIPPRKMKNISQRDNLGQKKGLDLKQGAKKAGGRSRKQGNFAKENNRIYSKNERKQIEKKKSLRKVHKKKK